GDGLSLRFYLSQTPFIRSARTLVEEEYENVDPNRWAVTDPAHAVAVGGGKLLISGGTGGDGQTLVQFIEKIELGGAVTLQHGDVSFDAASNGVIGGLYRNAVVLANCVAGFRITPSGTQSQIQAVVNAVATGPVIATQAGWQYVFTTRIYASEIYRRRQTFHSSSHPAGQGRGGQETPADVRIVLEVHEIDASDPGSWISASTVLYDGVITGAPDYATYAPVNANQMHCAIAFTRMMTGVSAEVRSAIPNQGFRTRLVGSLADGAECSISTAPALQFYPQSAPAASEQIVVSYRGSARAMARVTDTASIAATKNGSDD